MKYGQKFSVVFEDSADVRLTDLHRRFRQWFEVQGARIVRTSTSVVCATCWGDGYTIPPGQGCIVTRTDPCPDCDGTGRWVPPGRKP